MTPISARAAQIWPIGKLKPHPDNARQHSEEQIAQLARSIEEFGFTHSILVDETGTVLAGHGKLLAVRRLGIDEVRVTFIDDLTDRNKAFVIADRRQKARLEADRQTFITLERRSRQAA